MIPSTLLMTFKIKDATPTVTAVSPSSGPVVGTTALTITGTGFTNATQVKIGGVLATSLVVVNSTTITCNAPAGSAGAKDVTVFVPNGGLGALTNGYTYNAITPSSATFDSGSGNWTVIAYSTLTVEVWGPGGSGAAVQALVGAINGNPGAAASTCSTLSMTANPGARGNGNQSTASGGTASGGNTTNTTGNNGTGAFQSSIGGGAPNGGGNVSVSGSGTTNPGPTGSTPGGGGASNNDTGNTAGGGASGGYSKSVYTFGAPGAPAIGASLAYSVGAGGAAVNQGGRISGAGANGRVKFSVA